MVTFAFDDFVFDSERGELWRLGDRVAIDRQPLELLGLLLRNSARIVSKDELVSEIWEGRSLSSQVVSVCVARLRNALGGASDQYIKTIYGRGYRFTAGVTRLERPSARKDRSIHAVPGVSLDRPTVGRSAALERLRTALARAESGRGSVCALIGEAGIGKTQLAEDLRQEALQAGFLASVGQSHIFDDSPALWPWYQAVESCAAFLTKDLVEPLLLQARTFELAEDPREAWRRRMEWFRTATSKLTATTPWLIILEDVQWADAATLTMLSHVVADVSREKLLILLTVRDSELPTEPLSRQAINYVLGHRACENVILPRLTKDDIRTYLGHRFHAVDDELSEAVFQKCEGIPFFMVELLRPWTHSDVPKASALTVSGHALDIIRRRLQRIERNAFGTLTVGAVIGRSFDLGLLAIVCSLTTETLLDTLDVATAAGLVAPKTDSLTCYEFTHELIRRVLYDDLTTSDRTHLHHQIAEALLRRGAADELGGNARVAHHLLEASPVSDPTKAVSIGRQAAESSARLGAYTDACILLRRCVDICQAHAHSDPVLLSAVLYELANCERAAGEPGSAHHFAESIRLARRHDLADVLFSVGTRMSSAPGTVAMVDAHVVLETALRSLSPDDHRRRAIALSHLAWTTPNNRDGSRVAQFLLDADKLANRSGRSAQRAVLRARLYYAGGPDEHEQALAVAAQIEDLALHREPMGRAFLSLEPALARVMMLMQRCNFRAAHRELNAYRAAVVELRHAELTWLCERMSMVFEVGAGNLALARERLEHLKCKANRLELHGTTAIAAIDWAAINRLTKDIRPFASQFLRALSRDHNDDPTIQTGKLRALVQFGLVEEARRGLCNIGLDQLYALPKSRDYLLQLANVGLTAAATEMRMHAEAVYNLLRPHPNLYVASLSAHCHGVVSHVLGILARTLGQPARAREHFAHAIAHQEQLGLVLPRLRSSYELGALLLTSRDVGERTDGGRVLEETHLTACTLGLETLRTDIESLLK